MKEIGTKKYYSVLILVHTKSFSLYLKLSNKCIEENENARYFRLAIVCFIVFRARWDLPYAIGIGKRVQSSSFKHKDVFAIR